MPASTTVTGMVLSAMPVGDYDKRLVILTKELGKISAFAKGARKPNSAFLACSEPFSFGEFSLYVGRSSYNIISAEISNYFPELRGDIKLLCYGLYFCEFSDYISKENIDEKEKLKLLYQTLRVLAKKTLEPALIRAVFELKMMAVNGEAPQVFECVKCKAKPLDQSPKDIFHKNSGFRFSAQNGGILCEACKMYDYHAIPLQISTLYTMQYILSKEIEKLFTFTVTEEILEELCRCMKSYLISQLDHEFKALELLSSI